MDFVDWRKTPASQRLEAQTKRQTTEKNTQRRLTNYVEEQIRKAEERGEFTNLPGVGKPLNLDEHFAAGEHAMAYGLLKNNGFLPPELELVKEIDTEKERIEARLNKIRHRSKTLRTRRMPLLTYEKRAFNEAVTKAATEYEQKLRKLNSKILTLNIVAPTTLHRPLFKVEQLVQQFRDECPLFTI